jgi:hypothetical protein
MKNKVIIKFSDEEFKKIKDTIKNKGITVVNFIKLASLNSKIKINLKIPSSYWGKNENRESNINKKKGVRN